MPGIFGLGPRIPQDPFTIDQGPMVQGHDIPLLPNSGGAGLTPDVLGRLPGREWGGQLGLGQRPDLNELWKSIAGEDDILQQSDQIDPRRETEAARLRSLSLNDVMEAWPDHMQMDMPAYPGIVGRDIYDPNGDVRYRFGLPISYEI